MNMNGNRMNEMWVTWKTKIKNALNGQRQFHIVPVKPINSNTSTSNNEIHHLEMFRAAWKLIDWMAFFVGVSVLKEVDINARMAATAILLCFTSSSLLYTIYVVWPSITLLLEVICILGPLVPGILKFRWSLKDVKHIFAMNTFFEKILVNHTIGRRSDDLDKEMKDIYNTVKILMAASVICFAIFALYPMRTYIIDGRLVPIMRLEFPFVDQTNMKGYFIGVIIMSFIGFYGAVGNLAFDTVVATLLMEYKSLVTLLIHDLDTFRLMTEKGTPWSTQHQDEFLKNICMKYNDIHSFLRCFQRTFSTIQCYSICTLYGSLICALYATLNNGWISGYGFSLFSFIQLYVQCILGTFVNIQNDRMSRAFYTTPWYEYPVRVQKIFSLLMHASTFNAIKLRIEPFALLNVETGLTITKSIFSYYTAISSLT